MLSLCSSDCLDLLLDRMMDRMEAGMKRCQPLFVTFAFSLVLLDAWIYIRYIFPFSYQLQLRISIAELLFALLCLGCILSSHILTMRIGGGTTKQCNRIDLIAAHDADECSGEWRWCDRGCDLPKPPQCHHCSICNVCVLQMDHHCPWMSTCIGFKNLHHFLRYLFWMSMGCCYSCYIYSKHLLRLNGRYPSNDVARLLQNQPGTVTMAFVCLVMGLGIFGLFLFNVYLVSRGYGTIDQAKAWLDPSEKQGSEKARSKRGFQSLAGNWKNVFDLQDARLWWILWIVPTTRPKKGRGYERALSSL